MKKILNNHYQIRTNKKIKNYNYYNHNYFKIFIKTYNHFKIISINKLISN